MTHQKRAKHKLTKKTTNPYATATQTTASNWTLELKTKQKKTPNSTHKLQL